MNRHYQQVSQQAHQQASRQARVAVYAATQSAADQQRYLLQGYAVLSVTLLLWVSLLLR
jgi:hypothetical protein